jgi:hypothetical protein
MIACAISARIRELATLWDVLLEVCEDHENMWCGATWKNVVWSRGVGVNLTYTWPEESGKLDVIWDETTIDFFEFPRSMNREEAVNEWRRYSLRVMKKFNDDWHDGWKRN